MKVSMGYINRLLYKHNLKIRLNTVRLDPLQEALECIPRPSGHWKSGRLRLLRSDVKSDY
jgi:hypothetical protein